MLREPITRRGFIKLLITGLAVLAGSGYFQKRAAAKEVSVSRRKKKGIKGEHDLVVAEGNDPYKMTVQSINKMGGMERFVKKGDTVVVKPNMAWDRTVEQAANTNPLVVAAIVELCYKAGAKRVNVFDRPCNAAERCYANSGIKKAAQEKGAKVYFVDDWNYVNMRFDYKSPMDDWPIYRDAFECDTFINVPVLKDHGLTNLTLSMKNFMGICGGDRGVIHSNIGRRLVDITDFMGPELTVIDAFRVLTAHGPSGGDLKDVVQKNKIKLPTDPNISDT